MSKKDNKPSIRQENKPSLRQENKSLFSNILNNLLSPIESLPNHDFIEVHVIQLSPISFNTPIMPSFNSSGVSFNSSLSNTSLSHTSGQSLLPQFNTSLMSTIGPTIGQTIRPTMIHDFNSNFSSIGKFGMNQLISSSGQYQFSF